MTSEEITKNLLNSSLSSQAEQGGLGDSDLDLDEDLLETSIRHGALSKLWFLCPVMQNSP